MEEEEVSVNRWNQPADRKIQRTGERHFRSSAVIKQDPTACRVNILLKNEPSMGCKGNAIPVQDVAGPKGPKRFRLPSFKTIGT